MLLELCSWLTHTCVPSYLALAQVRHAKRPRVHTFIATSEIHMQHKLRMTPDQVSCLGGLSRRGKGPAGKGRGRGSHMHTFFAASKIHKQHRLRMRNAVP